MTRSQKKNPFVATHLLRKINKLNTKGEIKKVHHIAAQNIYNNTCNDFGYHCYPQRERAFTYLYNGQKGGNMKKKKDDFDRFLAFAKNNFDRLWERLRFFFYTVLSFLNQKLLFFSRRVLALGGFVLEQLFQNPRGLYQLCISLNRQLAILLVVREILRILNLAYTIYQEAYTIYQELVYFLLNSPIYTYLNHFDVFFDVFIVLILLYMGYLLIRFFSDDDE